MSVLDRNQDSLEVQILQNETIRKKQTTLQPLVTDNKKFEQFHIV